MTRPARVLMIYMYSSIALFVNKDNSKDNVFVASDTGCYCSSFVVFQFSNILTAFVFFVFDYQNCFRCSGSFVMSSSGHFLCDIVSGPRNHRCLEQLTPWFSNNCAFGIIVHLPPTRKKLQVNNLP